MSVTIEGTIEKKGFGPGVWALVSQTGECYEIYEKAPAPLLKSGQKVKVTGIIRSDVMSFAMIGPVLEVQSFDIIDSKSD